MAVRKSKTVRPAEEAGSKKIMTCEALHNLFPADPQLQSKWTKQMLRRLELKLYARPDARDDAEEILQEVLVEVLSREREFIGRPRNEVLKKIKNKALSKAKDWRELHGHDPEQTERFTETMNANGEMETKYDPEWWWDSRKIEAAIEAPGRVADIKIALERRLSPQQQSLTRLIIDGYSYEEVGEMMGGWFKSDVERRWREIETLMEKHTEIPVKNVKQAIRIVMEGYETQREIPVTKSPLRRCDVAKRHGLRWSDVSPTGEHVEGNGHKPHEADRADRIAEADKLREEGQRLALILECEVVAFQPLEKQKEDSLAKPRASIATARKKRTGSYVRPLTPSPVILEKVSNGRTSNCERAA